MEELPKGASCLVVGDGNMTFSLRLARHAAGSCKPLVCTTFHTYEELEELYAGEIATTVKALGAAGAEVRHGVDATGLEEAVASDQIEGAPFDRVYWNFPHAGCVRGFVDGHPLVGWRHVNLMRKFIRSVRTVLKPGAIVKVTTNERSTGVDCADLIATAKTEGFSLERKAPFNDWELADYARAFGDYRDAGNKRKQIAKDQSDVYGQRANLDVLLVFKFEGDADEVMPPLELIKPPSYSEVVAITSACACGLICPTDKRQSFLDYHFKPHDVNHRELDGQEKLNAVEDLLMSFSHFE